jgi:hypothetical protein
VAKFRKEAVLIRLAIKRDEYLLAFEAASVQYETDLKEWRKTVLAEFREFVTGYIYGESVRSDWWAKFSPPRKPVLNGNATSIATAIRQIEMMDGPTVNISTDSSSEVGRWL